ncbi:MAG: hypothetical protein KAY37_12440 [Phycisphaerae bacterium]|nr:hypothetical protein [Phycisphaerae bacterium]
MTKRICIWLLAGTAFVLLTGGAHSHTSISGTGSKHEQVMHGTVGISGEDNELTILPGSEVTKLSIMGDDICVFVANGAVVGKVEIVGEDNEVSCPKGMIVEYSEMGEDNRLIYRP